MKHRKQTRRKFIKQSAAVTSGLILATQLPFQALSNSSSKSRVIIAHSDRVIDQSGKVDQKILQQLLDEAMLKLTNMDSLAKAWRNYFSSEDIIGMKVNGNSYNVLEGTPMVEHFPLLTQALRTSLSQNNFDDKNAIIWERSDVELKTMGYTIQKEKGRLRVLGTNVERRASEQEEYQPEFSTIQHAVGEKSTHLSNILETECTALINLPALKSHRLAGVTGALKNHYGSIDNPREFHDDDCCNPGIAEINNISVIREKHRLVICNALMGLWDGGPRWNMANMWMEGSLIIGEDPVAVDTVMLQMIEKKRLEAGLHPVTPMAKHLQLSEEIGLGNSKIENIELIKLKI